MTAQAFFTADTEYLKKTWMQYYLNLMCLKSNHPKAKKILEKYQMKIAETNEYMMTFFDELEAPV